MFTDPGGHISTVVLFGVVAPYALPVIEILHEVYLRFKSVHLFLAAVRKLDLLHCKKLPGRFVQPFEHLLARKCRQLSRTEVITRPWGIETNAS